MMVEEPDSENSLFSEPMKMRRPSAPWARPRSSITSRRVSRSSNRSRTRSRSPMALRSSRSLACPRTMSLRSAVSPPDQLARPPATIFCVSSSSSARAAVNACSSSALTSPSVLPRTRALRKFVASTSAEVGTSGGSVSSRFSTCPSSETSTTSARVGSRRTNSTCLSRGLVVAAVTTPAPRDNPERSTDASGGLDLGFDGAALVLGEVADLQERVDEEAQPKLGGQAAGAGVRRIDEAERLQVRHDVAHRRRRQRHGQQARDMTRAHRLASRQILVDDMAEDLARTFVELREADFGRSDANVDGQG